MRYADGGGLTPEEQAARERVRLEAAEWFERHEKTADIAAAFRVSERSVETWRRRWREGGPGALLSRGPMNREKLTPQQWDRLVTELQRGPPTLGIQPAALIWR